MIPAEPEAGLVLRYSFVWNHEEAMGRDEGAPATVVYGLIPQRLLSAAKKLAMTEFAKAIPGLVVRRTGE